MAIPEHARVTTIAELTARINEHTKRGKRVREAFLSACKELDLHFTDAQIEGAVLALEREHERQMAAIDSGGGVLSNGLVVQPVHPDDALEIAARANATMKPKIIA